MIMELMVVVAWGGRRGGGSSCIGDLGWIWNGLHTEDSSRLQSMFIVSSPL